MQYHIQTTPIWEAFKSGCDCPMCALYERTTERLIAQYLNEAVMEPDFRVQVNKLGFCAKHLAQLFNGQNKLGLALQLHTHTEAVVEKMSVDDTLKHAKKQAATIKQTLETCVICQTADEMMHRYAYTVAQMYSAEKEFASAMRKSNGFCLPHYVLLLENSEKAGAGIKAYLNALTGLQIATTCKVNNATENFTRRFDYSNNGGQSDGDALKSAVRKLKGRIL